jgi:hypothetical protein
VATRISPITGDSGRVVASRKLRPSGSNFRVARDPGTIAEVPRRSRVKNRGGFPRRGVVARLRYFSKFGTPCACEGLLSTALGYGYFSTTVLVAFVLPVFVSMNTAFELEMMYMTLVSGAVPAVVLPVDDTVYGAVNVCPATSVPI